MKIHLALCCLCISMLAGIDSITHAADIRQGLIAYWQMDGTDGVITPDATPFGNNLTLVNMTSDNFVPGQFGNAASLVPASTTYMTNLHSTDPSISGLPIYRAGSYTITMWVKGAAQTAKYLYAEGSTASTAPLLILQTGQAAANNAKLDVIIRPDAGATLVDHRVSTAVVFDDTWHHIAWVDDRGSVRLYVDGNLDSANFNYVPAGTHTMNTTAIGTLVRATISTAAIFTGLIDDVAAWKRALTAAEVQEVKTSSLMTPIPEFPAVIVTQPVGSTNFLGDRVTLSATADGGPPLGFQWFKGETELPGATANSLTLSNLVVSDSGDYTLRVTNRFGTNISSVAKLLVLPDATPDVRQGLVSYWPVENEVEDEQGRPTLEDLYSHNGFKVVANSVFIDLVSGQFDLAIPFNGIEQYCYRDGGFPAYKTPIFTVAMWVNAIGTGQRDKRFFCESSTNNNNSVFSLGTHTTGASGAIRVLVVNNSGAPLLDRLTTGTPLDGAWHHIAWTEINGQGRLYIDGVLDDTSFFYTREAITLDTTTIGAQLRPSGSSNFFTGALDEIATWSRRLSLSDVDFIRNAGIPLPIQDQPARITADPASQSVFTRANVTFDFTASGASPFFAQWRKNGTNLSGETNFTLMLNSVTVDDAGAFDVIVNNSLGRATSQVANLTVTLRPIVTDLKVDFNNLGGDDTLVTTEPGFSSFALPVANGSGPFTRAFGGPEITLSAIGGVTNIQSRRRATPVNAGAFTEERLLQDFVFAPDTVAGQGLDIAIQFLEPNQTYTLTIWSFDSGNSGRYSDWSANGVVLTNGYLFNGTALPVENSTYRFSYPVTADAQGTVLIQARRGASATAGNNVFLNALQITAPGNLRVGKIALISPSSLRLTFNALNPAATHRVEEKTNVGDPGWTEVPGAVFDPPSGDRIEVTIPVPNTATRFYRVVEGP